MQRYNGSMWCLWCRQGYGAESPHPALQFHPRHRVQPRAHHAPPARPPHGLTHRFLHLVREYEQHDARAGRCGARQSRLNRTGRTAGTT